MWSFRNDLIFSVDVREWQWKTVEKVVECSKSHDWNISQVKRWSSNRWEYQDIAPLVQTCVPLFCRIMVWTFPRFVFCFYFFGYIGERAPAVCTLSLSKVLSVDWSRCVNGFLWWAVFTQQGRHSHQCMNVCVCRCLKVIVVCKWPVSRRPG